MPGLFGFIEKENDTLMSLHQMKKQLTHESWYESLSETKCGINAGAISIAPFFSRNNNYAEDDKYILIIEGNVVKYQSASINNIDNFAEILLKGYHEQSEKIIEGLDGSFNILVYEKSNKELTLINDKFGYSYLYYYYDEKVFMFSPEYKVFLDYKDFNNDINHRAISLFLSSNVVLGNETYFDQVKLLPPASILTYKGGKLSIRNYWKPEFNSLNDKSESYFVDKAIDLFRQSIDKRVSEKYSERIILPLSGGLDSRLLFGLMRDKYKSLDMYTYGSKKSLDYKVARKIIKRRSSDESHSLINLNPEMIYKNAYNTVWLNEGHVDFSSSICRGIAKYMGPGKVTFLNGIIGAHLSMGCQNFYGLDDIRTINDQEEKRKRVHNSLGLNGSHKSFKMYLKDEYIDKFIDLGKDAANESFQEYDNNEFFCDQKDLFINNNLGRRMMGNIDLFKFYFHDVLPFIDYDLFDLYSTIPANLKIGHYLYQELIKKYFPDLAAIPWTNTGRNLFVNDPLKRKNLKRDLKQKFIYYTGRLSKGRISIKDNDTYIHNSVWLKKDKAFRAFVLDNIDDIDNLGIDFLDRKKILRLLESHDEGKDYLFSIISRIVTVILWYKMFVKKVTLID